MLGRYFALAASALLLLLAIPSSATAQQTIGIQVVGQAQFDVLYHRAASTGTGAAIGGLIGAGIQAGMEADKDSTKREALRPHVAQGMWKDTFLKQLNESLAAKEFTAVWLEGAKDRKTAKADIYLVLYPKTYGFRMVDTSAQLVSAYIEFQASYSTEGADKSQKAPKESFYIPGKKLATYETLLNDPASLNADLEAVVIQSAQRLANKLIYNVKR